MGDGYKLKPEEVAGVVNTLSTTLKSYKDNIVELTKLISDIETSSAWKDKDIKTAFVRTCRSYIALYKKISFTMESYIKYLSAKTGCGSAIDSAYSRG